MGLSSQLAPSAIARPGVVANAAARPASPYDGQVIYQQDTDQAYVWNGSAWVLLSTGTANPPGLELLSTTTLSGDTAKNIDSVFTAGYQNYKIVFAITHTSATGTLLLQFRYGGVTYSSANGYQYGGTISYYNAAPTGYYSSTATSLPFTIASSSVTSAGQIEVFCPKESTWTSFTVSTNCFYSTYMGLALQGYIGTTASMDGIRITQDSGGAITGTVRVYGYRN